MLKTACQWIWFLAMIIAAPLHAQEVTPARPAEYMIYQYPDVDMVVKVDVPETEFGSRVYGPESALIKSSEIPFRRIGPLFQFIPAVDISRQLMVKISPQHGIDRSRIKLELIQLSGRDRNAEAYAQAYQLFSFGTDTVHGNDATTWTTKAYSLRNAARAFASLGWEEMRLWSEFYTAHLVLHKLNDGLSAMEMATDVERQAQRAGFETIELAALILQADALLKAAFSLSGDLARGRFEQAQGVLERVAALAAEQGLPSEQARALFNRGLAYEQQADNDRAIRFFERALDVSLTTDNIDLSNEIRSTAAAAYEAQGRTSGAIQMLENIGSDLAGQEAADSEQELAETLFEQGRILIANYRYEEAIEALGRSLEMQRARAAARPWGPTGLALATAFYSLGQEEQAIGLIHESISRTPVSSHSRALIAAYGQLAGLYRQNGQFERMRENRQSQGELVGQGPQRAAFLLESGLDAQAMGGANRAEARRLLAESRNTAAGSADVLTANRASLHLCLLQMESGGSAQCSVSDAASMHRNVVNAGIPRYSLEADFVLAQILRRAGRRQQALERMDRLVDDILFFRQSLPGVLGAWYWQQRMPVFSEYMSLVLAGPASRIDGAAALLALERIRRIETLDRSGQPGEGLFGDQEESLRVELARLEASRQVRNQASAANVLAQLEQARAAYRGPANAIERAQLDRMLGGLGPDEALLTYYFDEQAIFAMLATRDGVRTIGIPGAADLRESLEQVRQYAGQGTPSLLPLLESLGEGLVGPLERELPGRIYLQSNGPMNGFPFNLLVREGRFLAERFEVINLLSLAGLERRPATLRGGGWETVFLAGNPQTGQQLFSYDVTRSREIDALTDLFVGPGLHIVQGVALRSDEFGDARFAAAELIHLATPGTLDPAFPDRSRLKMSVSPDSGENEFLGPPEIRRLDYRAGLVFLSGTAVVGTSKTPFDSGLGFVSDFLESGASSVIASLWPIGDEETAAFSEAFYQALEESGDIGQALSRTRLQRIGEGDSSNFRTWAGFQLYIR